ncbi:DUF1589 domain-containing protein [Rhodopirellula europaea]|uniref:DUF1589 domain-containing protein n=1 Tax=Rhodopirellula europaea TaxID=1263866 RepID=UPI0009D95B56
MREFARLRPVTSPGGTWPTSTENHLATGPDAQPEHLNSAETSHMHSRRPGLTWQPSRCFGTKRGDSSFIREFAWLRPVISPGGTWPTSTSAECRHVSAMNGMWDGSGFDPRHRLSPIGIQLAA